MEADVGTRSFPFHCQRDAGWLRGPWPCGSVEPWECGCRGLALLPWHAWPPAGSGLAARWWQPDLTSMGGLALRAGLNTLPSAPSAGPHLAGTKWEVEFHPCSDLTPAARRLQLVPNLNLAI